MNSQPVPPPEPEPDSFLEMTLAEHLEELRQRIVHSAIAVLIALVAGFLLAMPVLDKIGEQANVDVTGMQVITPTEPFTVYFRVALYIAIALAMPVLIYQLMRFVAPGLTQNERNAVIRAIPFIFLMFVMGVAFAFFIVIPRALEFLSGFGGDNFRWDPHAEAIVSFYLTLLLGVGLMFELPVVMFVLARLGVMTAKRYGSVRKYAFLLCLVAAAIITPTPDPYNMALVAIPMYGLYEVGTLLSRFARRM